MVHSSYFLGPASSRFTTLTCASVDDLQADAEGSRRHILRHLQALTIPLRAAINIVYSCFNAPPNISLKAYQAIVTPVPLAITTSYFDCFKAKLAELCDAESTIVNQVLEELRPRVVNATASVHAEAALLSLARAASKVANDGTPIAGLLPVNTTWVLCVPCQPFV